MTLASIFESSPRLFFFLMFLIYYFLLETDLLLFFLSLMESSVEQEIQTAVLSPPCVPQADSVRADVLLMAG